MTSVIRSLYFYSLTVLLVTLTFLMPFAASGEEDNTDVGDYVPPAAPSVAPSPPVSTPTEEVIQSTPTSPSTGKYMYSCQGLSQETVTILVESKTEPGKYAQRCTSVMPMVKWYCDGKRSEKIYCPTLMSVKKAREEIGRANPGFDVSRIQCPVSPEQCQFNGAAEHLRMCGVSLNNLPAKNQNRGLASVIDSIKAFIVTSMESDVFMAQSGLRNIAAPLKPCKLGGGDDSDGTDTGDGGHTVGGGNDDDSDGGGTVGNGDGGGTVGGGGNGSGIGSGSGDNLGGGGNNNGGGTTGSGDNLGGGGNNNSGNTGSGDNLGGGNNNSGDIGSGSEGNTGNGNTGSLPAPQAPTEPVLADARPISDNWNTQGDTQTGTQNNATNLGTRGNQGNQGPIANFFSNWLNPTHTPQSLAQEAREREEEARRRAEERLRDPTAFGDIYSMLTGQPSPYSQDSRIVDPGDSVDLSRVTFQTDEFGEVIAYGVSEEQLQSILSDIAGREVGVNGLPTVSADEDGELSVELMPSGDDSSSTSSDQAATPDWLRDFVLSGGSAVTDSSGNYGYVTSPDNTTIDIYERDEGRFITLEAAENGTVRVGLQGSDGNTVFLPTGGLLDADAAWGEFTSAFVDIAGREPEQTLDPTKIPLTPFDIAVRELYGDEALEFGIPFSAYSQEYTLGKNGELIPVGVIDAAMEVAKERAGVTELQKYIAQESDGKIQISTRASSFPLESGVDLGTVRIMPVQQQMLLFARLKGEMEARGHENIGASLRTAIFNTYDSTVKKVAGITAFTIRIDEEGNPVGNTKVTFSLKTLVTELFATFAGASDSTLANNALTRFFGSLFSPVQEAYPEGNVYRVPGEEPLEEPQTFGEAAVSVLGDAIAAPFKLIGKVLGGLFK